MNWCDLNESVKGWASEEVAIPYRNPLDNKVHKYMVDFYIEVDKKKYLVEVKPERFTKPPDTQKRKTKRYIQVVAQYGVNEAKWKSAKDFCK